MGAIFPRNIIHHFFLQVLFWVSLFLEGGHVDWREAGPHQVRGGVHGVSLIERSLEGNGGYSVSLDYLDGLLLGVLIVHFGLALLEWGLGHHPVVADDVGVGVALESSVVQLVELVHLVHLGHLIHLVHLGHLVPLVHLGHWVPVHLGHLVSVHAVLHALLVHGVEGVDASALLVLVEGVHSLFKHVVGSVNLVHAVGLHSLAVHSVIHLVVQVLVGHSLLGVNIEPVHLVRVHAVLHAVMHLVLVIHAVALVHVESVHLVVHAEHIIPIVLHAVVGRVVGHDRVGESRVSLCITLLQLIWVRSSSVKVIDLSLER